MSRPYIIALEMAGALPVLLPLALGAETLRAMFERMDGLFMAGGGDVNPVCYGEEAYIKTEGIDSLRDDTELTLIKWALDEGKPLLGVCRGVQTLNVAMGGTLVQDITDQLPNTIRHQYYPEFPREYVAHPVSTVSGSRLGSILGATAQVNSFHHQAVSKVASGFNVSAHAPDGVIEAIEAGNGQFAIGVQWHPESLAPTDPSMLALFAALVHAA
jgi:putative glutamine amidotransferase